MPTLRQIVRETATDNYRFSSIVLAIVKSPAFLQDRIPEARPAPATRTAQTRQSDSRDVSRN
jgi:hypothetical protein